ncbi:MAG: tetratricopeptide repeat protein [Myxococcales bacterium]|jgi:hypothetical protein
MSLALLLALLQVAAPPVSEAEALAAKGDGEALFLKFGSVKPDDYGEADRARLAKALLKAARATRKDPFIGISLAARSNELVESVDALVLLAAFEVELDQRGSAAKHLDRAISIAAKNVPALMARADLAMKERDFEVAVRHYERAKVAGAKAANKKLAEARASLDRERKAVADLKKKESEIQVRVATAAKNATREWMKQIVAEEEEESERGRLAPDGVRVQEIHNFVFTYLAGKRNARQMSDFERKVERLLEKTYDFVCGELGHRIEKRTEVKLYSREEYAAAYGATPQAQAAGFWDGQKIVINGGSTVDERFAEVMVHEFTHAVVTDIAGHGRVPRWVNEGLAEHMRLKASGQDGEPTRTDLAMLAALKKQGRLPTLAELDEQFVRFGPNVHVAYVMASVAAKVMIDKRGYNTFVDMLKAMGKTARPLVLVEKYIDPIERIEEAVHDEIK